MRVKHEKKNTNIRLLGKRDHYVVAWGDVEIQIMGQKENI